MSVALRHRVVRCIASALIVVLPAQAAGQAAVTDRNVIRTTAVTVDGIALRVRSGGLAGRRPGHPVVVFESGGGMPLETWDPVLPAISAWAPVIAYDRAGTGESPWDSLPPTPARVVSRLRRLLEVLQVEPPFVLVGHSWGGALSRYFAGAYPRTVAGLVYVDPTDISEEPADEIALFETIGSGRAGRDAFYRMMERAMAGAPPALAAEGAVTLEVLRREVAARDLGPTPDVPTTVILAGKSATFPPNALPFDTRRYATAVQARRLDHLAGWVRGGGEFLVATEAGHLVHAEAPALVIEAVRRLVKLR